MTEQLAHTDMDPKSVKNGHDVPEVWQQYLKD